MSKRRSFILSWPMIVALIFGYNLIFDDDDEDKKELKIKPQKEIVSVSNKPDLQTKLKEVGTKLKEVGKETLDIVSEELKDLKTKKEEKEDDTDQDQQPPEKEIVKKEKPVQTIELVEETDPETDPEEDINFKKL